MDNILKSVDTSINTSVQTPVAQKQTLRQLVQEALQNYFSNLGDSEPKNLYGLVLAEVEEPLLEAVMQYCKGNQSKAAKYLGISRGTLRKKLKIYGFLD